MSNTDLQPEELEPSFWTSGRQSAAVSCMYGFKEKMEAMLASPDPIIESPGRGTEQGRNTRSEASKKEIDRKALIAKEMLDSGIHYPDIAAKFNCSSASVMYWIKSRGLN